MVTFSHKLFLAIVLIFADEIKGSDDFTEQVKSIVDCFKDVIKNGMDFEDHHITSLENIHVDEFDAPITIPMFQGDYNFTNILLKGTSDFDVSQTIDHVEDIVDFKITLNNIDFSSQYSFDSKLMGLADFLGKGDFKFHMTFDISGSATGMMSGPIKIKLTPAIESDLVMTGLSIGERMSRIVSKQMNSIITTALNSNEFREGFSLIFGTIAELIMNKDIELPEQNIIGTILRYCNIDSSDLPQSFLLDHNTPTVKSDL